jgi:hypothetical protein
MAPQIGLGVRLRVPWRVLSVLWDASVVAVLLLVLLLWGYLLGAP